MRIVKHTWYWVHAGQIGEKFKGDRVYVATWKFKGTLLSTNK